MASRQADSMKLVNRVRAVVKAGVPGWSIEEKGSDGFRVLAANGEATGIHMTYSDINSLNAVRRFLESNCQLREAEQEGKRLAQIARREAIKRDREAAERKAAQLAESRQEFITKAAGPYLTEVDEPDIGWLTTPHPAPWMRWMYITPKIAGILLEDINTGNRKLSEDQGYRYAAIILDGKWQMTHQGMAVDVEGVLQDGQHRLYGVQLAGDTDPDIKVPFPVFVGMPKDNFKAIDEGRVRSAAQMLSMKGVGASTTVVAVMRTIGAWESEYPRTFHRKQKFTQQKAFDVFASDTERYTAAVQLGTRYCRKTKIGSGVLGAAYYLITKVNGDDNAYVTAFFEGLGQNRKYNTNLVLPDADPRRVLLSKFAQTRPPSPIDGVLWIVLAWNNMVRGHHPSYLRASIDTTIPSILRCVPGDGSVPRGFAGELDNVMV